MIFPIVHVAVGAVHVEVAAGAVGSQPAIPNQQFQISVRAIGRLSEAAQFDDIILKSNADGTLVLERTGTPASAVPERMSLMRFPYGRCSAKSLAAAADAGLIAIQWDVVSGDPDPHGMCIKDDYVYYCDAGLGGGRAPSPGTSPQLMCRFPLNKQ